MINPCYPIAEVIPHKGAMVLLDEILGWDNNQLCAMVVIRRTMPMADDRGLPAWVGVELMAQATAALGGCQARQKQRPVKIGFLTGTRRYTVNCSYFPLGARLEIRVLQTLQGENGLSVFECELAGTGEFNTIAARASINIFQPDDPEQFIPGSTT